ncbi:hypothetical protein R3P38DRAFT_3210899 [Favolaschia claudopus]|uniref:DOMON domain-containing protein n=1 Tax=Favolaschia claudopus TaxID=2862362 RepID=A0AAW0AGJ4_9AGAR
MNVPHIAQQQAPNLTRHVVHSNPSTALSVYQNPGAVSAMYVVSGKVVSVYHNRPGGGPGMSSFHLGPVSTNDNDILWHTATVRVLSDIMVAEGFYTVPTQDKIYMSWLAGPNGRSGMAGLHQANLIAVDHAPPLTHLVPADLAVGTTVRALVQMCRHEKHSATGQLERYLYVLTLQSLEIVALANTLGTQ